MTLPAAFFAHPIAHRALHDRANGRVENSLASIQAAIDAGYGIEIDIEDQKRRYTLLSLLQVGGFSLTDYQERYGSDLLADIPQLRLHRE